MLNSSLPQKTQKNSEIDDLLARSKRFIEERDWSPYQTPKNMSMALSIEAAELLEKFLWLTDEESREIRNNAEQMQSVRDEIADVFHCLLRMCDLLNVDLQKAFNEKMVKNEKKYPVSLAKGDRKKYTELKGGDASC